MKYQTKQLKERIEQFQLSKFYKTTQHIKKVKWIKQSFKNWHKK